METDMTGKLVLCATPIGNLEDTSQRAIRTLAEADVIACEDTRRTRKLLSHHGITPAELVVYNEGNERRQAGALVKRITRGHNVVLVSDAGMPGLSDPGYRLVQACIEAGRPVEVVPGPSAAISALAVSGLPPGRFAFEGFLPRKASERRRHLEEIAEEPRTLVFYESPHRIAASLADMAEILGDRPAAIARELTKMYEEVLRGGLEELAANAAAAPPRGEIVVVVSGAVQGHGVAVPPEELARRARALMDTGVERKEAMSRVARASGASKRDVFDALVQVKEES
jgi:16S rRNA (cytidine1402-2'-O)-methyltransferase